MTCYATSSLKIMAIAIQIHWSQFSIKIPGKFTLCIRITVAKMLLAKCFSVKNMSCLGYEYMIMVNAL